MNKGAFFKDFDESFDIDEFLYKLYNTYLKLKFDPTFRNKNGEIRKKVKKKNSPPKNLFTNDNINTQYLLLKM